MEVLGQDLSKEVTEPTELKPTTTITTPIITTNANSNIIVIGESECTTTTTTTTATTEVSRRANGNKRLLSSDEDDIEGGRKSLKIDPNNNNNNNNISDFCLAEELSEQDIMNLLEGDDMAAANGHRGGVGGGEMDQMLPPPQKRNKMNNMLDEDMMGGHGGGGMMDECGDGFDDCDPDEMGLEHNGNGMSQIDLFGRNVEVRFLISSRDAGAIIGRGGSNITHLRKTFDAPFTVQDSPSPERVLTVVANMDKVTKIVREILKFTEPFYSSLAGQKSSYYESRVPGQNNTMKLTDKGRVSLKPTDTEIRLLLHTSHAGGLIGKGGARITQLRRSTGSGIKIFSDCCPISTERVCIVYGQPETVVGAVRAIVELVSNFPVKGPTTLYDPKNCDPYVNYGGFIINPGNNGSGNQQQSPPGSSLGNIPGPILPHQSYGARGGGGDGDMGHGGGHGGRGSMSMQPPMRDSFGGGGGGGMPSPIGSAYGYAGGRRHSGASSSGGYSHGSPNASGRLPSNSPHLSSGGNGGGGHQNAWPSSRMMPNEYGSSSGSGRAGRSDSYMNLTQVSPNLSYCGDGSGSNGGGGSALKQIRTGSGGGGGGGGGGAVSFRDDNIMSNIVPNHDGTSTATIQVPNSLVGAIMGKGGYRIKEIRMSTYAEINIAKSKSPDNNRLITVKGLKSDVQRCVILIKKSIEANCY